MAEFFQMGGHWPFIWPAYGVTALGIAGVLILTLRRLRRAEERIAAMGANRRRDRQAGR